MQTEDQSERLPRVDEETEDQIARLSRGDVLCSTWSKTKCVKKTRPNLD